MRKVMTVLLVAGVTAISGCGRDNGASSVPAEVPVAGTAAEVDPGPAPGGQWEPPVDEAQGETPPDAKPPAESSEELPADEQVDAPATGDVTLQLQSWDETERLIASHRGKVVVVDFWATSCLPCRREFPHLVALQKSHGDAVACISVSLDYSGRKSKPPETYRESVLEFLVEQRATIDNVLSTDDPDELQARLKLPPIPLVWVYDRQGRFHKAVDNGDRGGEEFTYEADVLPLVQSLLDES